jgi:hypothetical protein
MCVFLTTSEAWGYVAITVHIELWVENLQGRSLGNAMYKGDINPLKLKLFQIIVKTSVRTSKRTQHLTITNVNVNAV